MTSSSGNQGWAQLRQQARSLESQTETLLHTYSQLSTVSNIPTKPTKEEQDTEAKLEEVLQKRDNVVAHLGRLLDSEDTVKSSALKQSNLSLLREKLAEQRRTLSRLRSDLQQARNRANLLPSVRDDIQTYHANNPEAAEEEYMLGERNRIDNSHNMVDGILSTAYATNESFNLQRETLASVNRRITMAASQVPGLNSIIGKISARKRRDGFIMGGFIAACFIFFFFFM